MSDQWSYSKKIIVRTSKEYSVFIYFLMESLEGVTAYTTIMHSAGDLHRDLLLTVPECFLGELLEFIGDCGKEVSIVDPGN